MSDNLTPLPKPLFRIGALVPPANPTVEIEYPALVPADVAVHFMRLPIFSGDLDARNKGYVASFAEMVKGFGHLKLDAIAIALTGSQYRLAPLGDRDLCAALSDAAGVRVETATIAITRALKTLGEDRLNLMSPYPDYQTRLAVQYWQAAGYHIHHVKQFADALVAYHVTGQEISDALIEMATKAQGTIILSGTGMRTIETLALLKDKLQNPLLASNICSMWSITNQMGAPSAWMRAVMPASILQNH